MKTIKSEIKHPGYKRGPVAWMAETPVAANLLMFVLLVAGVIVLLTQVKQEIFPAFEIDRIDISVSYPGASPEEVEKGIILAVEEAINGLEGVKQVSSNAYEGSAFINVDLLYNANRNKTLADIKNAIDRVTSFPLDAEEPTVKLRTTRREVLDLVLYGKVKEKVLRELAENVRDDLLKYEGITQVELADTRPLEIHIEVPERNLRAYGLTIEGIAGQIRKSAMDLPAGGVKTRGGEVLLRTRERRDIGEEFEDLTIISTRDGTAVRLSDIARITDGFAEEDVYTFYNGLPAIRAKVYRIGDQTPLDIAKKVKEYKKKLDPVLPPGVSSAIWLDRSELFHQRVDLLKRNAVIGLFLVLGILGLFLEIRLAFWVTMGIPISFLGSFLFLPVTGVSINMISLFGFIVTLGMVVDDAIVVGESIYVHRQEGLSGLEAAINGVREVLTPVSFSIITSVVAFSPLFFVPGTMGKIFRIIPSVVILVLLLSLFESIYILPAHLAHLKTARVNGIRGKLHRFQAAFSIKVTNFASNIYGPMVRWCVKNRWITWAAAVFMLLLSIGMVKGGRVKIDFFPKVESDWVVAVGTLPFGVSIEETAHIKHSMETALDNVINEETGDKPSKLSRGIVTYIRDTHQIWVVALLVPSDKRDMNATQFADKWRDKIGYIAGLKSLTFDSTAGGPKGGKPVDVQLSHRDIRVLEMAAEDLAEKLKDYEGVTDIEDGFATGKPQFNFKIRPQGSSLGLTASELGRQIRTKFWGAEALRQQRGRDMIRVMVRLPLEERVSEYDIEQLLIRTPNGGEIPLFQAAEVTKGISYSFISRTDGKRTVNVTAETQRGVTGGEVVASLKKKELPELISRYPGLTFSLEGASKHGKESVDSLMAGFMVALLIMYVLIAIPFNSYIQPMMVLSAIPFGFVGAMIGHIIMGYNISLISMMGLVALSGVVVNDSLVLIYTANKYQTEGADPEKAVCDAGIRRFRPIVLTSLTTFLGLTPMICETSLQARFLIPMAISLGFGVLFATVIILLMIPAFYVITDDLKSLFTEIVNDVKKIIGTHPEYDDKSRG